MYEDRHPLSEYQLSPDGLLRKAGQIVQMPGQFQAPTSPIEARILGSKDANAEAARRFMRTAQTPQQTTSGTR